MKDKIYVQVHEERDTLRSQLDESNRKLEQRIALEIDEHLKVVELQAKLEVAVEALKKIPHKGFPDEREYHPWYPDCPGCIAQEALKRLEA
jgi:hypothetical protein